MYADWGVDFIKCDDICDSWMYRDEHFSGWHETRMLHEAIMKTGRNIVLSLSPGPAHIDKAFHYCNNANMWRITDDFWDKWELLKNMFWRCEMWQDHVKAGCFPDCDMLPVGTVGAGFGEERLSNFNYDELMTMMTLWCMFRSPLMIGGELTKMTDGDLSVLVNEDLLELMKDGWKASQVYRDDRYAVWKTHNKSLEKTVFAVFNLSDEYRDYEIDLNDIFEDGKETYHFKGLWTKSYVESGKNLKLTIPPHGVKAFK